MTQISNARIRQVGLLARNRDFRWMWVGESVSAVGSQLTLLALPLLAASQLAATPLQMGLLGAAQTVPFLLFAVLAGVWVDRYPKRPILIGANLAKGLVLGLVPLLAFGGLLAISPLLVIAFAVGACTVLIEVAYQSYVPAVVDRDDLVEANSRLTASTSVAEIGGPGLGGLLVGAVTAPLVIAIDSLSFVFSAVTLGLVRHRETRPARPSSSGIARQIGDGFRATIANRNLLAFAGEAATYNVAWHAIEALLVLWAVTELGLTAAALGLLLAIGSVGALIGALVTNFVARRFGVGRTMWISAIISNTGVLLIPLAHSQSWAGLALLAVALVLRGLGMTGTNVHTYAIRQAVTPTAMLGRTNAAYRVLTYGFIPLGALIGGLLGQNLGLRPAIAICAVALFPSWLWLFFSPARRLDNLPTADQSMEEPVHDQQ